MMHLASVTATANLARVMPDDAELLAAVARGEPDRHRAALGELARRYGGFVFAAATRQLGDRHAAEDVTQLVFLTLARKAGAVRGPALAAWLHQTTRYAAINARRRAETRRRRERAAARPEVVMPYVLPEPNPLLPLLDDAIAQLGQRDRRAIIDRYLRGRDVAAVAESLGVTPAAARKRLERAIVKLRHAFIRLGYREGAVLSTAAVAATLTAAGASSAHAAPIGLAAAVTSNSSFTPAALSAKGMLAMLSGTPLKLAAAVAAGVITLGGAAAMSVHVATAQAAAPSATPAATTAAIPSVAAPSTGVSPAGSDFAHAIAFKVVQPHFAAGDAITVTDVRSTAADLRSGICRISGTYALASRDEATLAGSVTARASADGKGPWNSAQQMTVKKGSGTFTVLLPISIDGWPHVSFYDGGESFGGVYVGDASVTDAPPSYSLSNDYPKLAPFAALRWKGDDAEVRVGDTWYRWLKLNDRPVSALIADAKQLDTKSWQKRIGEDLVELCARSKHSLGETVTLDLMSLDGKLGTRLTEVHLTAENRRSVMEHRTW